MPGNRNLKNNGIVLSNRSGSDSVTSGSIRNYISGDPLNKIHWNSTARRGELVTKLMDVTDQKEMWIILDCHKLNHFQNPSIGTEEHFHFLDAAKLDWKYSLPADTLEAAVSITASLANTYLRYGFAVGLMMNLNPIRVISPDSGLRQQKALMEELTSLQIMDGIQLPTLIMEMRHRLKQGCLVFLVTPQVNNRLWEQIDQIKKVNVDLRLIHIDRSSYQDEIETMETNFFPSPVKTVQFKFKDPLIILRELL
jgi:hypothetical protein